MDIHPDDYDRIAQMRDSPPKPTQAMVEANRRWQNLRQTQNRHRLAALEARVGTGAEP